MHLVQSILYTILKHAPLSFGAKAGGDMKEGDDIRIDLFLNEKEEMMIGVIKSTEIEVKPKKAEYGQAETEV